MLLPDGVASGGGTVRIEQEGQPYLTFPVDDDGSFTVFLDPQDPGPVTLVGESRGTDGSPLEAVRHGVRRGDGPITLELRAARGQG
jgi:hypothetical protein